MEVVAEGETVSDARAGCHASIVAHCGVPRHARSYADRVVIGSFMRAA
jgi:hypothetical protein